MSARQKLLFVLFVMLCPLVAFAQQDVPGSADHPLISRYPGSYIDWYEVQQFDQYKIATGPVTGYRTIDDWLEVEGKLTRIYYALKGKRSITEVYRNYLSAVRKAGFEIVAEGLHSQRNVSKEIGGRNWLGVLYQSNPLPPVGEIRLLVGSSTSGGSGYIGAKLSRPEGDVYVSIGGTQYAEDEVVFLIDIIEVEPMEGDLITIDADAMSREIELHGKVALYGIYFDFDKATIKPESKPELEEIAKLLKNKPKLKLYVVGHTDMKGTLAYNMKLSADRARAVVEALTKDYGIATDRLEGQGVGPLAPVSNNLNDKGRAKNRRVELVQM